MPSGAALPEKSKLELLLGVLQRFVVILWISQALIISTRKSMPVTGLTFAFFLLNCRKDTQKIFAEPVDPEEVGTE